MPKLSFKSSTQPQWYPNPVLSLEIYLRSLIKPLQKFDEGKAIAMRKNIAYSLQYLEFMSLIEVELSLSKVLKAKHYKTFILHGCSVIEAIFYYLLIKHDLANSSTWKVVSKFPKNSFSLNNKKYRHYTYIEEEVQKFELETKFTEMCDKVKCKKLTGLSNDNFHKNIPYLRKLRNRIHIRGATDKLDTDYWKFSKKDYILMKSMLKLLLTSSLFSFIIEAPCENDIVPPSWKFLD